MAQRPVPYTTGSAAAEGTSAERKTRYEQSNSATNGNSKLRVALVHYWYVRRRGGERVLEVVAKMFPQADLFVLLYDPQSLAEPLRTRNITSSFLQKLPGVKRLYWVCSLSSRGARAVPFG